ncbi:MAG: SPFH domain-containing protein, partial [Muribaculaceae bacterium]|nr:SPFH domain-containing protein [Muribaculaceae bacterium]
MGFFSRGKSGGVMNVIRCDLPEYLVWKWRPEGQELNSTTRENSIRYGSSLRVKDGEVAVFVYKQKDGSMMDFIMGPFDETIKTANFPVLSSIVGMAFGGESPFQAEIYFINLAGNVQIKFGIPYFDVADPRFLDFIVPIAAGGTITFNITDYKQFIKLNRMQNFDLDDFKKQVKDAVIRRVKSTIT